MPINLKLSSSANGTRNIVATEQGGGQYLLERNLFSPTFGSAVSQRTDDRPASSTAEYYGLDGLYPPTPQDMSLWGSFGAALIASSGYRYVCIFGCDHPETAGGVEEGGWGRDAQAIYAAFTNDPGILPDPSTMRRIINNIVNPPPGSPGSSYSTFFNNCFVYSPEDATTPLHVYVGSAVENGTGTVGLSELLFAGANFDGEFTSLSESHPCPTITGNGLTSYQIVYRDSSTDYHSFGGFNPVSNDGTVGKWVSTDGGINFTKSGSAFSTTSGSSSFPNVGTQGYVVNISGQDYVACREENSGHYATLVPFSDTTGVLSSPAPIRISSRYDGNFPVSFSLGIGDGFLQYVGTLEEDGLLFLYVVHNYFGDVGLSSTYRGKLPENGGGTNEQYIDIYCYPIPGKSAQYNASAPCGVKASCASGVATISWFDPVGGRTFRVKRGTDGVTFGTTVGDFTATSCTNSPTVGSVYYYQVITLVGGVEQASRIVSTYVS